MLALMGANLPAINSISPMNWSVDFAMPYTADRFYLEDDKLRAVHPPFDLLQGMSTRSSTRASGTAYARSCRRSTRNMIFSLRASRFWTARRLSPDAACVWPAPHPRRTQREAFDRDGARLNSEQIKLARAIVRDSRPRLRADGMIPVIYVVNNPGYSDYLFRALKPVLSADKILYLSSHDFALPNDPRKYLPDSHFVDATDDEMARGWLS